MILIPHSPIPRSFTAAAIGLIPSVDTLILIGISLLDWIAFVARVYIAYWLLKGLDLL